MMDLINRLGVEWSASVFGAAILAMVLPGVQLWLGWRRDEKGE